MGFNSYIWLIRYCEKIIFMQIMFFDFQAKLLNFVFVQNLDEHIYQVYFLHLNDRKINERVLASQPSFIHLVAKVCLNEWNL